jgi:sensor histidine kinase regulating citrate/malate metabolism
MKQLPLQLRIFLLIIVIVFISIGVKTVIENKYFEGFIIKSGAEKVLYIAKITASDKMIIEAFKTKDPSLLIQPRAEEIRKMTNTSFVVVINMDSIRYSHPNIKNIGKTFVGGDEGEAKLGRSYVSEARGTLGISQRAFVPIYNKDDIQIGVVSVGLLQTDLEEKNRIIRKILLITASISVVIGLIGGILLANNIRKTIYGLEPHQIATLLLERDAIISSVKEGIIAVDKDLKILLINNNAKILMGIDDLEVNDFIFKYFPSTKLPIVIEERKEILNQRHLINGRHLRVNNLPLIHNDNVIGAVTSIIDFTEILNLTAELDEIKSYSDALRAQQHEYLNKLNVMSGLIQLEKFEEATNYIVSTVSNQQKISDLLRNKILAPAISGLIIAKMNRANEQHIELTINPESSFPIIRKEPSISLVLIIGNIIENSIESLNKSKQSIKKIDIFFKETDQFMEIIITDNGPGISPGLKEKIFDYGYSSKKSSTVRGLGLFLVKEQLELLQGELELNIENKVEFIIKIAKKYLL